MSARVRRLTADHERIRAVFADHPFVRLVAAEGSPPEKYVFEFHVKGLVPDDGQGHRVAEVHRAEVFLPLEYPRRPPFCRMITPVFHPNIDPQKICIGDHWSSGEALDHLVVRIAEMICYQSYNVQSPLNGLAAAWAETHLRELPLQREALRVEGQAEVSTTR